MKGIIIAGGKGTRLTPLTTITNKHLLGVFDRPMIMYPLETLKSLGVRDVLVISGPDKLGDFAELLGDGSAYGVNLTYRVQAEASGIGHALGLAKDFAAGEKTAVILGDNIFENERLPLSEIRAWQENGDSALLILKRVAEPRRFGVPEIRDGKITRIIEKPEDPPSDFAVTGLYFYPPSVFDAIPRLIPSGRGEIEITDVNNLYVERGACTFAPVTGFWVDAGTHESLIAAALWVAEQRGFSPSAFAPEKRPKLTFTVCIPTYYGGPSLVRAVQSIRDSEGVSGDFRVLVNVDGNPLAPEIEAQLEKLRAEIIFASVRGGQAAGLNRMIHMASTDIVVLTQDDVFFKPDALRKLLTAFENDPQLTMANANVMPVSAETLFERVQEIGQNVVKRIVRSWQSSDNYLAANGRAQVFRTAWIKQFKLPETLVNSDAYKYFENKFRGGKFMYVPEAVVYDRSPLKLSEYVRQTKKYQASAKELAEYFPSDLTAEYGVPFSAKVRAYLAELAAHPILAICYFALFIYGRLAPNPKNLTRFWDTDISTKRA
jgi:glucose-1-phosphate thymidylyltransferase